MSEDELARLTTKIAELQQTLSLLRAQKKALKLALPTRAQIKLDNKHEAMRLARSGWSAAQIAAKFSTTKNTVNKWLHKLAGLEAENKLPEPADYASFSVWWDEMIAEKARIIAQIKSIQAQSSDTQDRAQLPAKAQRP